VGVYRRHNKLWLRYTDRNGKLVRKPTPYRVGQEALAERALEIARAIEESGGKYQDPLTGVVSADRYARQWLREREATHPDNWKDNRTHLELHILPHIGGMKLADVRPRHLVALFAELRRAPESDRLSPKSIRNVYGTVRALLRDAFIADLIPSNPCVLTRQHLGELDQHDPLARAAELYTHEEVEKLISGSEIPIDRRVFYALEALAGLRLGEAAGLRWKHYDPTTPHLGRLLVVTSYDKGRTKTRRVRYVPVHPTLAAILTEWRLAWPDIYGGPVLPESRIVGVVKQPGKGRRYETGALRTKSIVGKAFRRDLAVLGLTHRRGHDLRSSFISLAEADGADRHRIQDVTHTARVGQQSAFEGYLVRNWPTLCEEVAKLKIKRRGLAGVVSLQHSPQHSH
jgi:integrase